MALLTELETVNVTEGRRMSIHILDVGRLGGKLCAIRDSDLKRKSTVSIVRQNEINRMLDYYDWFLKSHHVFLIGHDLSQLKRVERVSSSFGKKSRLEVYKQYLCNRVKAGVSLGKSSQRYIKK
jgi:hypothetical protein